jgi:hypothetical protein
MPGEMAKRIWVILGAIWVAVLLLAFNTTTISGAPPLPVTDDAAPFSESRVDLYGNDISNAVGDYRVDSYGELYEEHAPDTAVLKLGPAGT